MLRPCPPMSITVSTRIVAAATDVRHTLLMGTCRESYYRRDLRGRILVRTEGWTPSGLDAGQVVMRDVVEQDQTRLVRALKVEQVETRRQLLDAITVAAQFDPQPGRDQQTVGRLVRDDQHRLAGMAHDDVVHDGQRPGEHLLPSLATLRGEMDRVALPGGIFLRKHPLHLVPPKPLPASMVDLAQTVGKHRYQAMRTGDHCRGRHRTTQRACIHGG